MLFFLLPKLPFKTHFLLLQMKVVMISFLKSEVAVNVKEGKEKHGKRFQSAT